MLNSIFLSVALFKSWTADSTRVSEVTLIPNYEERKENQTYWSNWCWSQPAFLGAQ